MLFQVIQTCVVEAALKMERLFGGEVLLAEATDNAQVVRLFNERFASGFVDCETKYLIIYIGKAKHL